MMSDVVGGHAYSAPSTGYGYVARGVTTYYDQTIADLQQQVAALQESEANLRSSLYYNNPVEGAQTTNNVGYSSSTGGLLVRPRRLLWSEPEDKNQQHTLWRIEDEVESTMDPRSSCHTASRDTSTVSYMVSPLPTTTYGQTRGQKRTQDRTSGHSERFS